MRLIDADKLYPDRMTNKGCVAISQSQIAKAKTVDAVPMSVIEEIEADIIEMRKRDPLYYYVSTEDILDWVLNTIDRKVKEHET